MARCRKSDSSEHSSPASFTPEAQKTKKGAHIEARRTRPSASPGLDAGGASPNTTPAGRYFVSLTPGLLCSITRDAD